MSRYFNGLGAHRTFTTLIALATTTATAACAGDIGGARPPLALLGTLHDLAGRAPIAGATVDVAAGGTSAPSPATTSADGAFRLDGLALSSAVVLRARAPGYADGLSFPVAVRAPEAGATDLLLLAAPALAALADASRTEIAEHLGLVGGRVVDAQGQPVAGVRLAIDHRLATRRVVGPLALDAEGRLVAGALATTATGLFVFLNVPPGPVTLTAELPEVPLAPTAAWSVAGGLALGPVRVTGALPATTLAGRVVEVAEGADPSDLPVPDVEVTLAGATRTQTPAYTDFAGAYRLDDVQGESRVVLLADHPDYAPGAAWPLRVGRGHVSGDDTTVHVLPAERLLEMFAAAGIDLAAPGADTLVGGTVADRDGRPVRAATVQLVDASTGAATPLAFPPFLPDSPDDTTGPTGRFFFIGAPPGDWRLVATSARYDFPPWVDVAAVAGRVAFGIVRSAGAAPRVALSGRVRVVGDEDSAVGLSDLTVAWWPSDGRDPVGAPTDLAGRYVLRDLPSDDVVRLVITGEDVLAGHGLPRPLGRDDVAGADLFAVTPGFVDRARRRLDVNPRPGAVIGGQVVGPTGIPFAGVTVQLAPGPGAGNGPWYFDETGVADSGARATGPDGRFLFFAQPGDGVFALAVRRAGALLVEITFNLSGAEAFWDHIVVEEP